MKKTLQKGLSTTRRVNVDKEKTIDFMGDELRVYATPWMLKDMEITCRDLIKPHLEEGQESVGAHVVLDHVGASLLNSWVDITATVTGVDSRRVSFEIEARDPLDVVGKCEHVRFVIDTERQKKRLEAKANKLKELGQE